MHLNCPDCTTEVLAEDMNLVKTIAKCKECNNIFDFTRELEEAQFPALINSAPEIIMPPGIEVLKMMHELEVSIKWREKANYFTPLFALFWNMFLLFMVPIMFMTGEIMAILFMIPFILAGVWLIYSSVSYLVNTTYILVDEEQISIEHRPINFLIQKDRYFPTEMVQQLFVKRYEVGKKNDRPIWAWSLDAQLKDGTSVNLIKNIHNLKDAQYIEQEVEKYLNISNEPVAGEWSGRTLKN